MVEKQVQCYHCSSRDITKDGKSENGKQMYSCKACGRRSREQWKGNAYPEEFKTQVLQAYNERMSLRGIERVFGVTRQTVASWLKKTTS